MVTARFEMLLSLKLQQLHFEIESLLQIDFNLFIIYHHYSIK